MQRPGLGAKIESIGIQVSAIVHRENLPDLSRLCRPDFIIEDDLSRRSVIRRPKPEDKADCQGALKRSILLLYGTAFLSTVCDMGRRH
jgi:hypothetical protein